ncbi:MAG: hypothetical protein JNL17_06640 [Cyclobacteriaceae bacterium]|nr:hypothetical protein [Cyclobacteriaceae bacterium]
MKYAFVFGLLLLAAESFGQDQPKVYTTSSGEMIFSFASISANGSEEGSVMRFSPVINIQNWVNFDKADNFGFFTGLSVRNVGVIFDVPGQPNTRVKARTYNVGIPFGLKLGNLQKRFFFVGYELELPVNYKEKIFINEEKEEKTNIWFSNRVPTINHSLMAGIQLPYGSTLKFKYYLTNFYNKDYSENDGQGNSFKPYENLDINVFYISLSFGLLKNTDFYYGRD